MKRIIIRALASGKVTLTPQVLNALKEFSDVEIADEGSKPTSDADDADDAPPGKCFETDGQAEPPGQRTSGLLQRLLDAGLTLEPRIREAQTRSQAAFSR